jgi:hypothetical protein
VPSISSIASQRGCDPALDRDTDVTNPEGIGGKSNKIVGGKSCHQQTREEVAKETGVSPRTIANDAAYAEAGKRNMAVIGKAKNQKVKMTL